MVCSIDDIVSRRPGKHTRFPIVYSLYLFIVFFFSFSGLIHHCASPYLYGFSSLFILHFSLLSRVRRTNWNFEYFIKLEDILLGVIQESIRTGSFSFRLICHGICKNERSNYFE